MPHLPSLVNGSRKITVLNRVAGKTEAQRKNTADFTGKEVIAADEKEKMAFASCTCRYCLYNPASLSVFAGK